MPNKTTPTPQHAYRGETNEFYAVCLMGITNCKNNLARFALLKAMYTQTYITDFFTELAAAAAIPSFQTRTNATEMLRDQLMLKTDQCIYKWIDLKMYITQALPKRLHKQNLDAAGYPFFKQAEGYNWEKVSSLMGSASQFITDNSTILLANNNMPANFQTELDLLKSDTFTLYNNYRDSMTADMVVTTQKINANNQIYEKFMLMLKDGQHIFRHEPELRKQFVYTTLLERVRGASSAYQEFEVPKNSSIKIKKLVANTPFANIGDTELVVCIGDVSCTPASGTTVPAGATILMQEDVTTITVLNTNTEHKGLCKTRVVQK